MSERVLSERRQREEDPSGVAEKADRAGRAGKLSEENEKKRRRGEAEHKSSHYSIKDERGTSGLASRAL